MPISLLIEVLDPSGFGVEFFFLKKITAENGNISEK